MIANDIELICAGTTNKGKVRQQNEDYFLSRPDIGLWIVADGMGGHERGDEASKLACKLVGERVSNGESVADAIEYAHRAIFARALLKDLTRGMGTTIVVLQITQLTAKVWWVGDSRAYKLENNYLDLVTHDHSVVQELLDQGLISEQEALNHPNRHVITQSLGMKKRRLKIAHTTIDLHTQQVFLLCTDGLNNELKHTEISHILTRDTSLSSRVDTLINLANDKFGRDNITAVLVQVKISNTNN